MHAHAHSTDLLEEAKKSPAYICARQSGFLTGRSDMNLIINFSKDQFHSDIFLNPLLPPKLLGPLAMRRSRPRECFEGKERTRRTRGKVFLGGGGLFEDEMGKFSEFWPFPRPILTHVSFEVKDKQGRDTRTHRVFFSTNNNTLEAD